MATKAQSETEIYADISRNEGFEVLQAILSAQGQVVSYEEAADIGNELLGFFEALGEINEELEEYDNGDA
ncbi:hypothetical protein H6796_01425 [Candidatus Nomurabacteria bacterium]|nr:hypothetical protein [Candidatus Nomurabacteria bacterium]